MSKRVNGKRKGKVGELEAAHKWAEVTGTTARRSEQYCGKAESADITHGIKGIHLECKRTARGYNVQAAIDQARRDSGGVGVPVALTRQNRGEWIVSLPLSELMAMVDILAEHKLKLGGNADV